ncbi:hypothetical protein N0V90_002421 [Kalmusia sp. IMI 367209]|nr:hypothetical protein N0V90_002421 [Kalmusia sp. IMI 367209]
MARREDPSYILWTSDWLLYPRRVEIYLREKKLPLNIGLVRVPISFDEQGKLCTPYGLPEVPGHVHTFPALCVRTQTQEPDHFIYESTAIIEYFEDVFPEPSMRGFTSEQRARPRMEHGQLEGAAKWGEQRAHGLLSRIEEWAERWAGQDGSVNEAKWLAGTKEPTTADCMLLSTIGFMDYFYGVDLLTGHTMLLKWKALWEGRESAEVASYPPSAMVEMARKVSDV